MPMKYGSVCSGIEAATVAWHGLGWDASFFSEIDDFPRRVLQEKYPAVPLHGDFTTIKESEYGAIDLLVGGTPCQAFSVAGLRKGFTDERGNLTLEFIRLAQRLRPRWLVWENVPGVLSLDGGRAFGSFLGGLAECGYGFSYRVLDAQYFGVPQRRRRVFVIGYSGDWRPAAAVLFERESLCGDITPGRGAWKTTSYSPGNSPECEGDGDVAPQIAGTVSCKWAKGTEGSSGDECYNLVTVPKFIQPTPFSIKGAAIGREPENGPQYGEVLSDGSCYTLNCTEQHAVAFGWQNSSSQGLSYGDSSPTLDKSKTPATISGSAIRRLTPRECERLQGFPDDYTLITYRGKPSSDGPRYKALGNSMAVPVMRWIGERIELIDGMQNA